MKTSEKAMEAGIIILRGAMIVPSDAGAAGGVARLQQRR